MAINVWQSWLPLTPLGLSITTSAEYLSTFLLPSAIISAHSLFKENICTAHRFPSVPSANLLPLHTPAKHTNAHCILSLSLYAVRHLCRHGVRASPLWPPRATQNDMRRVSCSLISSSHTHSGSAITSGGPVRHECYPVDNNHSGGRGRDPIPYLLTALTPPQGAQVALKKLVRYK